MVALLKMPSVPSPRKGIERRLFVRREVHLTVMGRRLDLPILSRRFPTLRMHLRDLSVGGASALVDEPLNEGERLTLTLPAGDDTPSWDACGRILRCEPSSTEYRIAIAFDPLPAA